MTTDLADHIASIRIVDTHEHLKKEAEWVDAGPGDVLADLFANYVNADLITAGANPQAVENLQRCDQDIEHRFAAVSDAWDHVQFTGYGEAVRTSAAAVYGIDRLTAAQMKASQDQLDALRRPGQRIRLLRDQALLDHIQTDDFCWACVADESGPDFFLYDLSWMAMANGQIDAGALAEATGITVTDLATLRQAIESLFERYGRSAIAVKSQHAYARTLRWQARSEADAERALQQVLSHPDQEQNQTRLCLGDWCLARGVEQAIAYELPFKIHTGYMAGNHRMDVDRIRAGHLWPLLVEYPKARFVLMHIAYPYSEQLISLAKHFANVWVDLCWAWSINPLASATFVRSFLHAAPRNKLFAFGGDTMWPTSAYAYSIQARRWLSRALQQMVDDGQLTEPQAMTVATCILRDNQMACFDLHGTREALADTVGTTAR